MEHVKFDSSQTTTPVLEWEIEELRIYVPTSLTEQIGIGDSCIRVPKSVDRKIRHKHAEILDEYLHLNQFIDQWAAYRLRENRTEVYMEPDKRGNRTMIVIGHDRSGSLNLISIYQVRQRNWRNRELVEREQR